MRYFFRVEYDGTRYGGWQYQPNCMSVQQLIEEALAIALRTPARIIGAGRTDAGVHARAQGVHFDVPDDIGEPDPERLMISLNALLPHDIAVYGLAPVRPDFHARYSAVSRLYKYYFSEKKSPLNFKRAWPVFYHIDWDKVAREIERLPGLHDFTAFCSSGADTGNMECEVSHADLSVREDGMRVFTIQANRFIYKMVRSIAGTLVDIGRGRIADPLGAIIASKDRNRAGETAPACGLVLERVDYPPEDCLW
jgi:tRNA pseudouridine38-40 synthase